MAHPDQNLNKGTTTTTIENTFKFTPQDIKQQYKTLLKPLIKDDDILDIMASEENMQKIQYRLQYQITLTDINGNQIANLNHIGQKTITRVLTDMKGNLIYGQKIKYKKDLERLSIIGYRVQFITEGTLHKIKVRTTLTR